MHKKKIAKAVKRLRTFSKKLDKEKHERPKLYEKNEEKLDHALNPIMKL